MVPNDAIFELKDGQSILYRFPSLLACDKYWAHIFGLLIEWIPSERPIFVWNPHEWLVVGRQEVEKDIFSDFTQNNKYAFYVVGAKTPLDLKFKREWSSHNVSISTDEHSLFPENYYLNVFDDFIIEVLIDKELSKKIERFYQKTKELTTKSIEEFESLISENYPVKVRISRKKKKAYLLRKKLSKNFYIPKELSLN